MKEPLTQPSGNLTSLIIYGINPNKVHPWLPFIFALIDALREPQQASETRLLFAEAMLTPSQQAMFSHAHSDLILYYRLQHLIRYGSRTHRSAVPRTPPQPLLGMGWHCTPLWSCSCLQRPWLAILQFHIRVPSTLSGGWHLVLTPSLPTLSNTSFTVTSYSPSSSDLSATTNVLCAGNLPSYFPAVKSACKKNS